MMQLAYHLENTFYRVVPRVIFQPRWCFVFECSIAEAIARSSWLPSGFEVRWAVPSDTQRLVEAFGEEVVADRLTQEDRAVILLSGDALVGTIWIAKRNYCDWETGIEFRLPEATAWIYGSWVHRKFRGSGYYSELWRFVAEQLHQEGIEKIRLTVDCSNGHSQRVHRNFGSKSIGSIFGLRFFGRSLFRLPKSLRETNAS
jgi:ribosomal protein S18 acetylase RimI-like enzyme